MGGQEPEKSMPLPPCRVVAAPFFDRFKTAKTVHAG
jgi:hypothetical protein